LFKIVSGEMLVYYKRTIIYLKSQDTIILDHNDTELVYVIKVTGKCILFYCYTVITTIIIHAQWFMWHDY